MSTNTNTEKVIGGRVAVDVANVGANGSGGSVAHVAHVAPHGSGSGRSAGSGNAGSSKRQGRRPLPSKARRFDWAECRRKDLAKPIEHLRYVEQLLDQYVDAKSRKDADWVLREMGFALCDAIGAIVEVHQML